MASKRKKAPEAPLTRKAVVKKTKPQPNTTTKASKPPAAGSSPANGRSYDRDEAISTTEVSLPSPVDGQEPEQNSSKQRHKSVVAFNNSLLHTLIMWLVAQRFV
jgi:hypothetical protein